MRVEWFGQSAFLLDGANATVAIDPFADVSGLAAHGIRFEYPAISGVSAELVLITHEHADHNGAEAIAGDPVVLRSTAGTLSSPIGTVVAIASEHDDVAGTQRGPNTVFVFELDGLRVAHFGDFGQRTLRDEQAAAIGRVDMVMLPVGGGPTIGPEQAMAIVARLSPRWTVPMHYRTERVGFLEPPDAFLETFGRAALRLDSPAFDTGDLSLGDGPMVVVPAAP